MSNKVAVGLNLQISIKPKEVSSLKKLAIAIANLGLRSTDCGIGTILRSV